jgi:HSP20 family protein
VGHHRSDRSCLFLPAAASFEEVIWRPAADIYRTPTGWLAKFELAGVRPDDFEVQLQGRTLRLRGARRDCLLEEGVRYHSLEITYCSFERSVEFPVTLEEAEVRTEYRDGMLIVRIRLEEERP